MFSLPFPKPEKNILAVLAYFEMFDHPLTSQEILELMPGKKISEEELQQYLHTIKNISSRDGFYFLKGHEEIVTIRKNRNVIAEKFWKKVRRFVPLLQTVPFVKMVAVCNTLAFGSANENSDIDLFIITAKNRIFLARTLSTLLFTLLGIRRHGQKIAGRFCLSFYISEEMMDLQNIAIKNDIYLLYWLKTLQPLYGKKTYSQFLRCNTWTKNYFPDFPNRIPLKNFVKKYFIFSLLSRLQAWVLGGFLGDFIEKKLYQHQQKRYRNNQSKLGSQSSVIISKTMLKFHNIDRRKNYSEEFKEKLFSP